MRKKKESHTQNSHLFFIHNYEQLHVSCLVQDRPLSLGKKENVLDNFRFINSSVNKKNPKNPHDIVIFHLIPPVV